MTAPDVVGGRPVSDHHPTYPSTVIRYLDSLGRPTTRLTDLPSVLEAYGDAAANAGAADAPLQPGTIAKAALMGYLIIIIFVAAHGSSVLVGFSSDLRRHRDKFRS
jgi:hypothetical protein